MATGLLAADSASPVTGQVQGQDLISLATGLFGAAPAFWGRYFTSPSTAGSIEYRHALEDGPLNAAGIPVLPIARQSDRVNGTVDDGSSDAIANVNDLLATFGSDYLASQGGVFFLFLDVEGNPSLSLDYYTGWANALSASSNTQTNGQVAIRPCIYAGPHDDPTWQSLAQAIANGTDCAGAWIPRFLLNGCSEFPDWSDDFITPAGGAPCPILAWQFAADCFGSGGFDCSQTNPSLDPQASLLDFLILPPTPETIGGS